MSNTLRIPDWFYGGPFLRVDNPDSDLLRRDVTSPIEERMRALVEFDGMVDGERLVAPFNDANGVDEITIGLVRIADYPSGWSEDERWAYPTLQGTLAEVTLRLETKLRHKPGRTRANWFREALAMVRRLPALYAARQYEEAGKLALEARA